jgi:nicotinate phosphoribosyltransferase
MNEEVDILSGLSTDAYFLRTEEVLDGLKHYPQVAMELHTKSFPSKDYGFGIVAGLWEIVKLLEGFPVDIYMIPEGSVFFPGEPVMYIVGNYRNFLRYETAIIGFVSSMSAIATKAARIKLAAENKPVFSFGTRRVHPAIAPAVEYASYIGGVDGVSNVSGARKIGIKAIGTMPHALILVMSDPIEAFIAFDKFVDPSVPRIALVDTYGYPLKETVEAAKVLKDKLYGVRIDTKDFIHIIDIIRWELKRLGYDNVKITLSGGLDEFTVNKYKDLIDSFGVGTRLASARVFDFALKIVEVNGQPKAKVSNYPGQKRIYRRVGAGHIEDIVKLASSQPPQEYKPLMKQVMKKGIIIENIPTPQDIREHVKKELENLPFTYKALEFSEKYPVIFEP